MKVVLGIIVALVVALGVWLSLTLGNKPGTQSGIASSTTPAAWESYVGPAFSIRYLQGYTVDESYKYQTLGPGKDIAGVTFTIPPAVAAGTNLSNDSYVSVEQLPNTASCTADKFLDLSNGAKVQTITEGGGAYSFASTTGAAAGNRYEESVYAIQGSRPCTAVRYFIHYGAIGNYPAGQVKEFDRAALLAQFDQMRKTLTIMR